MVLAEHRGCCVASYASSVWTSSEKDSSFFGENKWLRMLGQCKKYKPDAGVIELNALFPGKLRDGGNVLWAEGATGGTRPRGRK
jgi:hypothetical protein